MLYILTVIFNWSIVVVVLWRRVRELREMGSFLDHWMKYGSATLYPTNQPPPSKDSTGLSLPRLRMKQLRHGNKVQMLQLDRHLKQVSV